MKEYWWGSSNKRQVMLRVWTFNPRWWSHWNRPWFVWHRNCNHRCYCPCGTVIDFGGAAFGIGFIVFYSQYTGEIPCTCDKITEEMFPDQYADDEP